MTEYGRIHTDGSRSGGQPIQTDALREDNERLRNEYIKNGESHVVGNLRSIADEQAEQITRLLELLNAWTELAREHLDTELAGLTFAALRDAGHG